MPLCSPLPCLLPARAQLPNQKTGSSLFNTPAAYAKQAANQGCGKQTINTVKNAAVARNDSAGVLYTVAPLCCRLKEITCLFDDCEYTAQQSQCGQSLNALDITDH